MKCGGKMVSRWSAFYEKLYQSYYNDIPAVNSNNIGKSSYGGSINSDTCNADGKTWRLLVYAVEQSSLAIST